jgi:hypothetical protein
MPPPVCWPSVSSSSSLAAARRPCSEVPACGSKAIGGERELGRQFFSFLGNFCLQNFFYIFSKNFPKFSSKLFDQKISSKLYLKFSSIFFRNFLQNFFRNFLQNFLI